MAMALFDGDQIHRAAADHYLQKSGDAGLAMMGSLDGNVSDDIVGNNKYGVRFSVDAASKHTSLVALAGEERGSDCTPFRSLISFRGSSAFSHPAKACIDRFRLLL